MPYIDGGPLLTDAEYKAEMAKRGVTVGETPVEKEIRELREQVAKLTAKNTSTTDSARPWLS